MSKGKVIFYSILVMIAGVVMIVLGSGKVMAMQKDPIDLFDPGIEWKSLQAGQHVKGEITWLSGDYMYLTKKGTKTSDADTSRVYIVYSYDDTRLLGVYVNGDYGPYDKLADETVKLDENENFVISKDDYIQIDGVTRAMTADEEDYLKQTLRQSLSIYASLYGMSASDVNDVINEFFVPITVVPTTMLKESLMLIIGIAAIVITLIVMFILLKECDNAAKEEAAAMQSAYSGYSGGYGAYGAGAAGGAYGAGNQGTAGAQPRPVTGPGSYDSEGSADFGTFGMGSYNPNSGTQTAGVSFDDTCSSGSGSSDSWSQTSQSQVGAQLQINAQAQTDALPQNAQTQPGTQPQANTNFASFGRTNSEFIDFSTFKNTYNQPSGESSDNQENGSGTEQN